MVFRIKNIPCLIIFLAMISCSNNTEPVTGIPRSDVGLSNLIIISLDTLRVDRLGVYGYERSTSPFLDRLSRESVVLTDVLAQVPSTVSSHRAIFTSSYLYKQNENNLKAPSETLAGIFSDAGWNTAAFVDGGLMNKLYGNDQGFKLYDDKGGGLDVIKDKTLRWLEENRREKFFLFVHTYEIHCPYNPPDPFHQVFTGAFQPGFETKGKCGKTYYNVMEMSPDDHKHVSNLYDGSIRYSDKALSDIYEQLTRHGLDKTTLIVILSDHGESLGERNYIGHNSLYDNQLKIPVLLSIPDTPGRILDGPVESIDIMPTILDLFSIPKIAGLQGKSLTPYIRSKRHFDLPRLRLSELINCSIRNPGGWKLIIRKNEDTDELYNLSEDPLETTNLLSLYPDIADSLRKNYTDKTGLDLDVARGTNKSYLLFPPNKKQDETTIPTTENQQESEPDELQRQLRELGYIE